VIDFSAATSVLPLDSVFASGGIYAVETQGSILAQPPVLGAIAVIASALAYLGVWRGWARTIIPGLGRLTTPFGLGFFGAGLLLVSLPFHLPFPANRIFGSVILFIMFVGMVGMLWLPRFLLPRWFREEHGLIRKKPSQVGDGSGSSVHTTGSREADLRSRMLTSPEDGSETTAEGLRRAVESRSPGDTTLISGYLGGAIDGDRIGSLSAESGKGSGEIMDTAFGRASGVDDART